MIRAIFTLAACLLPWQVAAHPHVFVQARMTLIFDHSGEVAVKLDWLYDEFFSLLVSTDMGIDLDGDTVLTSEEQAMLDAQVAAWPPGYEGDLEVMQGDVVLPLSEKRDHRMTFEEGVFKEVHLRPIAEIPEPSTPLILRAYDPTYYTAYDLIGPIKIVGRDDCEASIVRADLDAAYTLVEELLYGRPANVIGPDEYFPEVGHAFADTVTVTCAQPLL